MKLAGLLLIVVLTSCGKSEVDSTPQKTGGEQRQGTTLACTAYHQPTGPGGETHSQALSTIETTQQRTLLQVDMENGFRFTVNWHYSLDTLYVTFSKEEKIAFATARIPTEDHNDSTVDVTLPSGERIYVACDFVEFRPEN